MSTFPPAPAFAPADPAPDARGPAAANGPAGPGPALEALRARIDGIDDAIHDLLLQRTDVVQQIGLVKTGGSYLRPAREASILRRLVGRHRGALPVSVVVRMWRELISGLTRLQGHHAVAVYAPADGGQGFWDIARDHFGTITPMAPVNSPAAALRAVSDGTATAAVVPYPVEDDPDPWWRTLSGGQGDAARVVARLPVYGRGNARGADEDCLVLARIAFDPSGDDHSLVRVELRGEVSRGRLLQSLIQAGLPPLGVAGYLAGDDTVQQLVEVAGHVPPGDPRLQVCMVCLDGAAFRVQSLGGYPVPLTV